MLGIDEVHVWEVALDSLVMQRAVMENVLSEEERKRAGRFHFAKHRERWILARTSLRSILARYIDETPDAITFYSNVYGKPELATGSTRIRVHFNLSHAQNLALIAVALAPIGIDVESIEWQTDWASLAPRVFTEREFAVFKAAGAEAQSHLFYQLWTRKEAYMKARGLGMSLPVRAFSVGIEDGASLRVAPEWNDGQAWYLFNVVTRPGYEAALACSLRSPTFRYFTWEGPCR